MDPLEIIWALPFFFSFHEIEEWNILEWYKKHYVNLPGSTNFSIHLHIIVFSLVGFILTFIAYQFQGTFLFSLIIAFISCFILLNTFQHIIWTYQLKTYSPGLITALIMLCVTIFVNLVLIKNNLIQLPYYALIVIIVIPIIKTLNTKNEMTPEIRQVHTFFINIENLIKKYRK